MERKYNIQKYEYWKEILGEDILKYCIEYNSEIEQYLLTNIDNVNISESKRNGMTSECISDNYINIDEIEKEIYFPEFYIKILNSSVYNLERLLKGTEQFWDKQILKDYALHLGKQLHSICLRTLISKMHEYKRNKQLVADSIQEEYMCFRKKVITSSQFLKEMREEYPVLFSCIDEKIGDMTRYYVEIIKFYKEDREAIRKILCNQEKIDKICSIQGEFSDAHNNGKQVVKIRLDNQMEILFKPHSMENEKVFMELLDWLSKKTGIDQLRYSFLTYDNHAWSNIVEYETCKNDEQLKRYYQRIGVQLFLAYILGTKDLHFDNIIASGEYPVLIDLEALVNIHYNIERKKVNDEINFQLSQSVLYTGILPFVSWNYKSTGIDSSAISGGQEKKYPFRVPVVIKPNTSEMAIAYDYPVAKKKKNLATVLGIYKSPDIYTEEIIKGFRNGYLKTMALADEFWCLIEKIKEVRNRYLVIDSQRYGMLLSSSYHPSLMKKSVERELFLNSIRKTRTIQSVCDSEIKSLTKGDIPYFYFKLDAVDLYDQNGVVEEKYFEQKALEIIKNRLKNMTEKEMDRQCEYIELSMTLSLKDQQYFVNETYKQTDVDTERKVDISSKVTELVERIITQAVWNQDNTEVNWSVVHYSTFNKNWRIKPMGYYMYNGLAGMLLLFGVLKNVTNEKRIYIIAKTLRHMLFEYTDKGIESLKNLQSENSGAYEGESSIVYVYLVLYKLTNQKDYIVYAEKHAGLVRRLVETDAKYDLISGNAGAAVVATKLYEITKKKEYLDMAERAIQLLKETAVKMDKGIGWITEENRPPLAGMAHGNAGILLAVLDVWNLVRKKEYLQLATEIWEYENSLYNCELNNWRDMRIDEGIGNLTDTIAWCHGAAGILLSRIIMCYNLEPCELKSKLEMDIDRALRKMKEFYRRDSWCLCHGNLGNQWIYNLAKGETTDMEYPYDIKLLPQEKNSPGLMNGYGGILYYLLKRQGYEVLNVLALEIQ